MLRILLVEDSPTQALQIKARLVDEGYQVQTAGNGQEALEAIPDYWPHLILTDMEMPVLDGLEFTIRSRETYPAIPIILITAKGTDQTSIEALRRGAAAYLPKAMLQDKLFATIDEVLDVMEEAEGYQRLIQKARYNEFRFDIGNDLKLIRPLVDLVKQMVSGIGLCDDTEAVRVGLAVEQAVRNAILHGNLELTTEELEADAELAVQGEPCLAERKATDPAHANREVRVTLQVTRDEARITVCDDGAGFDPEEKPLESGSMDPASSTGRGLVLIHSLMDEVSFNEKGNEITMVKRARIAATV